MTVVEELCPFDAIRDRYPEYRRDQVTLTWEERRQGHGRRRSDSGLAFAISLPGGTVLKEGDSMILDEERTIITVREALEPVCVVLPATPQQWAHLAYHVGNRHQPVMIGETELIFPQSPAIFSLLEQLRAPYTRALRPFTAALAVPGH